jgi:CRP/FNR family transcriptional regulator
MPSIVNFADFDCRHCLAQETGLCHALSMGELSLLSAMAVPRRFEKGETLIEQGNPLTTSYIIAEGLVKLCRYNHDGTRQIIGFLGPGDLIGAIKRSGLAYCSVETTTPVRVCAFNKKSFSEFVHTHNEFCYALLLSAMDEIEARWEHAIILGQRSAAARMAMFLLFLSTRWKFNADEQNVIRLNMPRSDIADHLCLTVETVSRMLSQFKQKGMIALNGPRTVRLKNSAALQSVAGIESMPTRHLGFGL